MRRVRDLLERSSSRFGRRLFALFALCAILPVLIGGALLLRDFNRSTGEHRRQELRLQARGFGMTLFDRLDSTDSALGAVIGTAANHDLEWLRDTAAGLDNVTAAALLAPGTDAYRGLGLDAWQLSSLAQGRPALLWSNAAPRRSASVRLVRQVPGGALLAVDLAVGRLWGDIGDYTADSDVFVTRADGSILASSNNAGDGTGASALQFRPGLAAAAQPAARRWELASWEVFLRSHYASESLWVVTYLPRASVLAPLRGAQLTIVAVLLVTVLVATLIASLVIGQLARRVQALLEGTRRISGREFGAHVDIQGNCEFAGLARSFNDMSQDLKRQFDALNALAEVDRLLQRSPDIEAILDRLLPSMASILHAWSVSVLMLDRDSPGHARVYDHVAGDSGARPVRRIAIDPAGMRAACGRNSGTISHAIGVAAQELMEPLLSAGAGTLELKPLEHERRLLGFLCIGQEPAGAPAATAAVSTADFADRLSIVLANLEQSEKLRHQAHFDSLTGLANRALFRERLQLALDHARQVGHGGALLYIDLDQFKHVNDTSGHGVGDQFLCTIAERIRDCVGADAMAARLGGDEFAVLLSQADSALALARAAAVLRVVGEPVRLAGRELRTGASIGIALFPEHGASIDELLMVGDIAMYRAKEAGRNRTELFAPEMRQRMQRRAELEGGLRRALGNSEFALAFQPIVRSDTGVCEGVEALLRWPLHEGGSVSPAHFVPVAEECGLIVELGDWVLRSACRQFRDLRRAGVALEYISVNVSAHQLRVERLARYVPELLREHDMRPAELQIEITESALADGGTTERTLRALARIGVRLALDDFGTGYSSLSYLRDYPVHAIKIDRSFVRDLPHDASCCRLVDAMLAMAAAVNKSVTAEGIETPEQLRYLKQAGCGSLQGYLLGKPMGAVELMQRLLATHAQAARAERRSA
ncbi:MAG: EAL domain-containing protein [Steroidobacteraceae bacterium]